jgi:hypothetical protein
MNRGVLYVATGPARYLEEAFLSAESVKRETSSELSITLATDQPEHQVTRSGVKAGIFDDVVLASPPADCRIPWCRGQLTRIGHLLQTPYQQTLHLDTDTKVLRPGIASLFERLSHCEVAMAEATVETSYSRFHYQRRIFNTGVILYARSVQTMRWLSKWLEISQKNFQIAHLKSLSIPAALSQIKNEEVLRRLLCMDQISLAEILVPDWNSCDLKVDVLDEVWNYRGPAECSVQLGRPIEILHEPRHSETAHIRELKQLIERLNTSNQETQAGSI